MSLSWASLLIAVVLLSVSTMANGQETTDKPARRSTDWFRDARWGVFIHYLTSPNTTVEDWNRRVNAFDVEALAAQLESVGAGFFFITIGQNSGHYCSPNETYDGFVGIEPSKCSHRDLIADLYEALSARDIPLLVYLPSGAPAADPVAVERLGWEWGFEGGWPHSWGTKRTGKRIAEFQVKWEAVIREWSERWGKHVRGWWFDGCYFADEMYRHAEPPNFASLAAATRAGNPDSIVAFNPGVKYPIIRHSEHEDCTAGEINEPEKITCEGRWVDGAQLFMLSYLGPSWCQGPPRFSDQQVIEHTRKIVSCEGVVAWDVPPKPNGTIPPEFLTQLKALGEGL